MKLVPSFAAILGVTTALGIAIPTEAENETDATNINSVITFQPKPADEAIVSRDVEAQQAVGSTANELTSGPCRDYTFIFARGSTEPGNLGISTGPATCRELKSRFGSSNVACQGVGGPYTGDLLDNALPAGTTSAAIGEAQRLFNLARTKCPNTVVFASGYSQGAAVMHGAIPSLSAATKAQIAAVVTFGDTRNLKDGGTIRNYPREDVLIICATGDLVCFGTLTVTAAHLSYVDDADDAARFFASKV